MVKKWNPLNIGYTKTLIFLLVVWGFFFFGIGAFIGSFFNNAYLNKFPEMVPTDKILIVAPHIDDEIISSGGLIQKAILMGAKVRIVYITNGDNNVNVVIEEDKRLRINALDFISLGEQRMQEGRNAGKALGLEEKNLDFLGYPDKGLAQLFSNYYSINKKYPAKGTKFTFNPYNGTYRKNQDYNGENLFNDLSAILDEYKPTILIVPHMSDIHPDHKSTFRFIEKYLLEKQVKNSRVWMYLVHYKNFPADKSISTNKLLYPPSNLFHQGNWYSLELEQNEIQKKYLAMEATKSQLLKMPFLDIRRFVRRNELFELYELN
ncbi:PIG-L family deacetylase [bacterium]|nr:PIG-L family deacetylase [bacterium]